MRPVILLFCIVFSTITYDAISKAPKSKSIYLDDGALYKKITSVESRIKHATFFAIVAQTDLSVNTGSSAVINAYNDMRTISEDVPIYFILNNNGGITPNSLDWYLKNTFRLPIDEDANLYIIQSKKLFELLHYGGPSSKIMYFYNTLLTYKEGAKYKFVTDTNLPRHKFKLTEAKTVKLLNDTVCLSYLDYFMPMSENEVLFLTDVQNMVVIFDLQTGRIKYRYNPKKSGVDYYCDLIAATQAECDTARKHNDFLEYLNRKNYYIFNMSFDDDHVYLSAGIQVMLRLKKQLALSGYDGGKGQHTVDSGKLMGYGFNVIAVLNKKLQLEQHYIIPEDILPDEDDYLCTECLFAFTDTNKLISSVSPDKTGGPLMAELNIDGKELVLNKFLQPVSDKHFIKVQDNNVFNYSCSFNNALHMITDVGNEIYSEKHEMPVTTLQGDGTKLIKEKVPKYYEESEELLLNYMPVGMSTDNERMYIVYKRKDYYLLEIKGKSYQTVDVINLANIKGIDQLPEVGSGENITLFKDKLYIKYIDGNNYTLTVYDINEIVSD